MRAPARAIWHYGALGWGCDTLLKSTRHKRLVANSKNNNLKHSGTGPFCHYHPLADSFHLPVHRCLFLLLQDAAVFFFCHDSRIGGGWITVWLHHEALVLFLEGSNYLNYCSWQAGYFSYCLCWSDMQHVVCTGFTYKYPLDFFHAVMHLSGLGFIHFMEFHQ